MRVAITGSSGLAKTIKDTLEATPHIEVKHIESRHQFVVKTLQ